MIALCPDQAQWIEEMGVAHKTAGAGSRQSNALRRLVDIGNAEPPAMKKQLFMIVRCHRCLQHTRGGDKGTYNLELPPAQWQWLEAVRTRCQHSTVGKTLRIIVDFYKPLCEKDEEFAKAIFGCKSSSTDAETTDENTEISAVARPKTLREQAVLRDGVAVRVHGLKSAHQLNNLRGICEHFDEKNERWQVKLSNGEVKALKTENLQFDDQESKAASEESKAPSEESKAASGGYSNAEEANAPSAENCSAE